MSEPTIIRLGERDYEVAELTIRKGKAWRAKLREPLDEVVKLIPQMNLELTDTEQVAEVVARVRDLLMDSVEIVTEIVIAYNEQLTADREYIFDHAYPSQVMDALITLAGLAFPIGRVLDMVNRMQANGQAEKPTSTN